MGGASREHPERGAGVADISQAENIVDDRDRMVQGYRAIDDIFGELVENQNYGEPACNKLRFRAQARDTFMYLISRSKARWPASFMARSNEKNAWSLRSLGMADLSFRPKGEIFF